MWWSLSVIPVLWDKDSRYPGLACWPNQWETLPHKIRGRSNWRRHLKSASTFRNLSLCVHRCAHSLAPMHAHITCAHAHIHAHTHARTHKHTHIHTHEGERQKHHYSQQFSAFWGVFVQSLIMVLLLQLICRGWECLFHIHPCQQFVVLVCLYFTVDFLGGYDDILLQFWFIE